jgi:hypothetical protein
VVLCSCGADLPSQRRRFQWSNPDWHTEYREDKLKHFLAEAYDDDVKKTFGEIPHNIV